MKKTVYMKPTISVYCCDINPICSLLVGSGESQDTISVSPNTPTTDVNGNTWADSRSSNEEFDDAE